ncbi:MAG TPA: alpha/beta hydrolase [Candidatus Brocadiia bacterium]|nr:alpha/beta hydrolase [Candidatus Brocadiia bacterium]
MSVRIERNVVYGRTCGVGLLMDVAFPDKGKGLFPAVVCVHGGGWCGGEKEAHLWTVELFAERGFVAATIDYRLSPWFKLPAHVEDCKCAVRFLRANAGKFGIRPDRIGATGDSAGGHLVLMLGLLDPADGMEGAGGWQDQPSKVQAVVNVYGPTDLATMPMWPGLFAANPAERLPADMPEMIMGVSDRNDPLVRKVSPITYIDSGDPPILSLQGSADPYVPLQQAEVLHDALAKAGVVNRLQVYEGAGHGLGGTAKEHADRLMIEFLEESLKE